MLPSHSRWNFATLLIRAVRGCFGHTRQLRRMTMKCSDGESPYSKCKNMLVVAATGWGNIPVFVYTNKYANIYIGISICIYIYIYTLHEKIIHIYIYTRYTYINNLQLQFGVPFLDLFFGVPKKITMAWGSCLASDLEEIDGNSTGPSKDVHFPNNLWKCSVRLFFSWSHVSWIAGSRLMHRLIDIDTANRWI